MTVASVQFNHIAGNIEYSLNKVSELVVFPEMCITGYWHVRNLSRNEIKEIAESIPAGDSTQHLIIPSCGLRDSIVSGRPSLDETGGWKI